MAIDILTALRTVTTNIKEYVDDKTQNIEATVDVDTTLSISGAAADAKTVGDTLGDINTALDTILNSNVDVDLTEIAELVGGDA